MWTLLAAPGVKKKNKERLLDPPRVAIVPVSSHVQVNESPDHSVRTAWPTTCFNVQSCCTLEAVNSSASWKLGRPAAARPRTAVGPYEAGLLLLSCVHKRGRDHCLATLYVTRKSFSQP